MNHGDLNPTNSEKSEVKHDNYRLECNKPITEYKQNTKANYKKRSDGSAC